MASGGGEQWADPGYFPNASRLRNALRLLVQLVVPPRGHRTVPTKTGSLFIVLTIGIGTAGFNTGQNILYVALALMLSAILISGLLSWMNFKGCAWRLQCGQRLRAGEMERAFIEVVNRKRWLSTHALSFVLRAGERVQAQEARLEEGLAAGARGRVEWCFTPERRGRISLAVERVQTQYPFGFLTKSIRNSHAVERLVWPARTRYTFAAGKVGGARWQGAARRPGEGVDLRQLRDYRAGDPPHSVHWKASARLGKLQVRETERESQPSFAILIQPSARLWRGDSFERMCSFAASLAEDLFAAGQLSAVCIGDRMKGIRDQADLFAALDQLALLEAGSGATVEVARQGLKWIRFVDSGNGQVHALVEGVASGAAA
jgi:uncharacterized protein (DUF58 family)